MLCAVVPAAAQVTTITFMGRVTDQISGQGMAGVAIVAQGNQTGTRVVITDAQGNYNLPFGANTEIKLRPYKTNVIFSPLASGFVSVGAGSLTGTHIATFTGVSLPFPILIFAQPPILLTEDSSLNLLALDGLLQTRDPLPAQNSNYFVTDKRTRLNLFLVDLDLFSGETTSVITVQARDAQQTIYDLAVQDLRKVPGFPWLVQLTAVLPISLTGPRDLTVSVIVRGQVSNSATLHIK
jgi:hypothetical protein